MTRKRQEYIYILHFDQKLAHAQHYTGSTADLATRLIAHATGAGSRICRALYHQGVNWQLAALGVTDRTGMRAIERHVKNQNNIARYCPFCSPTPKAIPGTIPYPVETLPFPTDSRSYRRDIPPADFTVRFTNQDDIETALPVIRGLMKTEHDKIGFLPVSGSASIVPAIKNGRVILAYQDKKPVGYTIYSMSTPSRAEGIATIHQCVVRENARLFGHGRRMITALAGRLTRSLLLAKVREDLSANEFWANLEFRLFEQTRHPTSRTTINLYMLPPTQEHTSVL